MHPLNAIHILHGLFKAKHTEAKVAALASFAESAPESSNIEQLETRMTDFEASTHKQIRIIMEPAWANNLARSAQIPFPSEAKPLELPS